MKERYPRVGRHYAIEPDAEGKSLSWFNGPAFTSLGRFSQAFNVYNSQVNAGFGFRF